MANWVPMGEKAVAEYEALRSRFVPDPTPCPACGGREDHAARCPVGVREVAAQEWFLYGTEAAARADEAAVQYALIYDDPWHPLALHWHEIAREIERLEAGDGL